jgi:hypothetical protein
VTCPRCALSAKECKCTAEDMERAVNACPHGYPQDLALARTLYAWLSEREAARAKEQQ